MIPCGREIRRESAGRVRPTRRMEQEGSRRARRPAYVELLLWFFKKSPLLKPVQSTKWRVLARICQIKPPATRSILLE